MLRKAVWALSQRQQPSKVTTGKTLQFRIPHCRHASRTLLPCMLTVLDVEDGQAARHGAGLQHGDAGLLGLVERRRAARKIPGRVGRGHKACLLERVDRVLSRCLHAATGAVPPERRQATCRCGFRV